MVESVLIIYNAVDSQITPGEKPAWLESNAGVLNEVKLAADTFEKLGIDYQTESLRKLEELPGILAHSSHKIVFNLVEELPEHITHACYVPAICRAHGKAFTGNDTAGLLLAQNKWHTKAVLKASGLPCPYGVLVPIGPKIRLPDLPPGKYIVKPPFSDASEGIDISSVVDVPGKALRKVVKRVHEQLKQPALVEQFIPERELNISVLQQNGVLQVLPLAEIDFSKFDANSPRIVDYSAKWIPDSFAYNNTPRIIPTELSTRADRLVRQYAIDACRTIGCQDYARVEFRLDKNENLFILEVNPNPDISLDAGYVAALEAEGISFEDFIKILLNNALNR